MQTQIRSTQFNVEIEKTSSILRKMTVKVPAQVVKTHFDKRLVSIQKTANLKGFRPGHAPLSVIKQFYGDDVRHQILHSLIDESFDEVVREQNLRAVGSPKIDTPDYKTGAGAHDHSIHEDQDFTYIATFEVIPEVEVKGYKSVAIDQDKVEVTEEDIQKVVDHLHQSQGQLVPVSGGLVMADGTESSRPVQKGDFADVQFSGGVVTEGVVQLRDDMKGSRIVEIGSNQWVPGFEDQIVGMKRGETKTFRITFPTDPAQGDLSGKEAEFTVTVNELKEKKLPTLDDELAKQLGYEGLEDLRTKAKEYLVRQSTEESDRKVKGELLNQIIEKNAFEVPSALVEGQTRALAQELAQEFKKQGYDDQTIQNAIIQDIEQLRKRAENQVRSSLVLESVAKQEGIKVSAEEIETELNSMAESMKVERTKIDEFYAKNPGRKEDLEFRLRQERTLKFLLDNAKIKLVSAKEK